jgi:hypothetical protein
VKTRASNRSGRFQRVGGGSPTEQTAENLESKESSDTLDTEQTQDGQEKRENPENPETHERNEAMETTAKVDIRKLQLLNDRIAQTIDALNQVRYSVHGVGLSHTGPMGAGAYGALGAGAYGAGAYGAGAYGAGYPFQGYPQVGFPQVGFPFGGLQGLQHTSPLQQQYGMWQQNPWQQNPWQQNAMLGVDPRLVGAMYGQGIGGLSHTSPELDPTVGVRGWGHHQGIGAGGIGAGGIGTGGIGNGGIGNGAIGWDPFTAARILQNFPFLQSPISPVL